jgi:hypothetical protein
LIFIKIGAVEESRVQVKTGNRISWHLLFDHQSSRSLVLPDGHSRRKVENRSPGSSSRQTGPAEKQHEGHQLRLRFRFFQR